MNFSLIFKEYYPHPIEKVWAAVTDPDALSEWLMETDFVPEEGRRFAFWSRIPSSENFRIECQLLEMAPPVRMAWSWKGQDMKAPTQLVFELKAVAGNGTNLTLRHMDETGEAAGELRKSGWPGNMTNLDTWLDMRL
jgi:uncharacterized protein YndB with AHSA1/START domain